jgi:hypothetical protein
VFAEPIEVLYQKQAVQPFAKTALPREADGLDCTTMICPIGRKSAAALENWNQRITVSALW